MKKRKNEKKSQRTKKIVEGERAAMTLWYFFFGLLDEIGEKLGFFYCQRSFHNFLADLDNFR